MEPNLHPGKMLESDIHNWPYTCPPDQLESSWGGDILITRLSLPLCMLAREEVVDTIFHCHLEGEMVLSQALKAASGRAGVQADTGLFKCTTQGS